MPAVCAIPSIVEELIMPFGDLFSSEPSRICKSSIFWRAPVRLPLVSLLLSWDSQPEPSRLFSTAWRRLDLCAGSATPMMAAG